MSQTTITYLGGPTAVLDYAGLTIVVDPTFDEPGRYPGGNGTDLVKTAGPAISRDAIGSVDLVLLSHHQHRDNLDYEGLELLATGVLTLSTMAAASDLFGGGVRGLDSWETFHLGTVTVTAVPALHGPPGAERQMGTVTGFVLEATGHPTVYVSGDNASLPLVEQIASRFEHVDVALLFAGAARVARIAEPLTFTASAALDAARILGARRVAVLHTEDWEHFSESPEDVAAAFAGTDLLIDTPRGARVDVG